MEEKNKKLAEKNTYLKIELDKLQINQRMLLRNNIHQRYFGNIIQEKVLNMLEDNLINIENALKNTIRVKEEIFPYKNTVSVDENKNLTEIKEEKFSEKNKVLVEKSKNKKCKKRKKVCFYNRRK